MTEVVAFEGLNRGGKSTQKKMAEVVLASSTGYQIRSLKFPNRQTHVGALIYGHFESEIHLDTTTLQYLLEANKMESQELIQGWMSESVDYILIDRYLLSGLVYGIGRGLDRSFILSLQSPLIKPTLTLVYDLDVATALSRFQEKTERDEQDLDLMHLVRRAYLNEAALDPTIHVINATQDTQIIHQETMRILLREITGATSKVAFSQA